SSGAISGGVLMVRTKSRETVNTKSALLVYMLVRNSCTIGIVTSVPTSSCCSDRRGPIARAVAAGVHHRGGDDAIPRPLDEVVDQRPANAEAHDQEPVDADVVHQSELIMSVANISTLRLRSPPGWPPDP